MTQIELKPLIESNVTDNYLSWLNDPGIRKYLGLRHRDEAFQKKDILHFLVDCNENKRFHWGIFFENCHIGNVSCSLWDNNNKWIDISFIIGEKSMQGKGLTTLSVGGAINYLFNTKGYNRVQSHAISNNIASIRVMEKIGMKQEAVLRERAYMPDEKVFNDEVIYSILKNEWDDSLTDRYGNVKVSPQEWE